MKNTILVMDEDLSYSKRFCNQANKMYGKKYNFITFKNLNLMKEYVEENKVESIILSSNLIENVEEFNVKSFYLLNENDKEVKRVGKKTYVYKLQSINDILSVVDTDLEKTNEKVKGKVKESCKLILFYSPMYIKTKTEIIKKIAKALSKKYRVLIIDIDEFNNYKQNVGLSNIIYNYKENNINVENLKKEVIVDNDIDNIKSVTYPEDFNVISNIDLANIVNEIVKVGYDYVFVNADMSYIKCQYILNDADSVILMRGKDGDKVDAFKNYLKNENQVDYKKVTIFDMEKLDRAYMTAFCKQHFGNK